MAKAKGSPKTGGAVKGMKYSKTLAWEKLGEFITEAGAQKVKKMLDQTKNPKEFFQYYGLLLEYFKPKLARTEQQFLDKDGEKTNPQLTYNFIDVKPNNQPIVDVQANLLSDKEV